MISKSTVRCLGRVGPYVVSLAPFDRDDDGIFAWEWSVCTPTEDETDEAGLEPVGPVYIECAESLVFTRDESEAARHAMKAAKQLAALSPHD